MIIALRQVLSELDPAAAKRIFLSSSLEWVLPGLYLRSRPDLCSALRLLDSCVSLIRPGLMRICHKAAFLRGFFQYLVSCQSAINPVGNTVRRCIFAASTEDQSGIPMTDDDYSIGFNLMLVPLSRYSTLLAYAVIREPHIVHVIVPPPESLGVPPLIPLKKGTRVQEVEQVEVEPPTQIDEPAAPPTPDVEPTPVPTALQESETPAPQAPEVPAEIIEVQKTISSFTSSAVGDALREALVRIQSRPIDGQNDEGMHQLIDQYLSPPEPIPQTRKGR